jgi:hypothetical protein
MRQRGTRKRTSEPLRDGPLEKVAGQSIHHACQKVGWEQFAAEAHSRLLTTRLAEAKRVGDVLRELGVDLKGRDVNGSGRGGAPAQFCDGSGEQRANAGAGIQDADPWLRARQHGRHEAGDRGRSQELAQLRLPAFLQIPAGVQTQEVYPIQKIRVGLGHWLPRVSAVLEAIPH